MGRVIYISTAVIFFALGAYVWKINNTGYKPAISDDDGEVEPAAEPKAVIVEVAGAPITTDDLEWEYKLHIAGVDDKATMKPVPDLGEKYDQELLPLRKALLTGMIERKLLFSFIQEDKSFDMTDPGRYTSCLKQWQDDVRTDSPLLKTEANRERLKTRLCERSILEQYMQEKLFPAVVVSEAEIVDYYKTHQSEFKQSERVTIRQIVLSNEQDAKRARAQLTSANFESLARRLSITPEAEDGGKLGPFAKGEVPEFFDVAFKMREGQISDILKSSYGFHLIKILDRIPASDMSLAAATSKIIDRLRKKKQEDEYQKWVERALVQVSVSTPKPLW
jgi:hypothetical protein